MSSKRAAGRGGSGYPCSGCSLHYETASVRMRRAQRLRRRQEFAAVYRRGRPFRADLLIMRVLRTGGPQSRFGFTASKAVGNAVVRNRVRRRMREAARSLPVAAGYDIVFNSRARAATATFAQIRVEMRSLLDRADLLEEPAV